VPEEPRGEASGWLPVLVAGAWLLVLVADAWLPVFGSTTALGLAVEVAALASVVLAEPRLPDGCMLVVLRLPLAAELVVRELLLLTREPEELGLGAGAGVETAARAGLVPLAGAKGELLLGVVPVPDSERLGEPLGLAPASTWSLAELVPVVPEAVAASARELGLARALRRLLEASAITYLMGLRPTV